MFILVGCNTNNEINTTNKYDLNIEYNYEYDGFSRSINDEYSKNTLIILEGIPNEGYVFEGYYIEWTLVSQNTKYEFNITKDTDVFVSFVKEIIPAKTYDFPITFDLTMGAITRTKNGSYEENTLITLTATPLDNYEFIGYFEGDSLVSNKLSYQFNLTKNISLEGIFKEKESFEGELQTFLHVFNQADFSGSGYNTTAGTNTINRLTFNYDAFSFLGQSSNGDHGNKFYDETNTEITFFPNISGTPNAAHLYQGHFRGDVARILFYMATRYDFLSLNDDLDVAQDTTMGKLSVLLKWNEEDPVDKFEIQRNNRIYEYQGNRNPYIDHPEIVSKIFG